MRLLTVGAALVAGVLLALSVPGTEALAGDGAAIRPKMQGDAGRIAVKLAPGARLADTADGSLTVIRDWPSLKAPGRSAGVPLEAVGQIEDLGVSILEPVVSSASASGLEVDLEAAAKELRLRPGVLWAEVSSPVYACLVPNDPYYPATGSSVGQWGVERVGLPAAWDVSVGSRDIVIAVLDTGINPDIVDFSGRIVSPYSVLTNSSQWPAWKDVSETGHGSAVAGIAAAQGNNGAGIAGAAWNVKIMPVKISDNGESDTLLLAEAIDYAAAQGADVINVSFATPPGSTAGLTLKSAVASAVAKGTVIVAAAGNWGATSVGYPAGLPGVIGVGATDTFDALWTQAEEASNSGSALDIAAPGGRILSYYKASGERFGYYGGTSMASPLVAGVAALILSVDPSLAAEEVYDILAGSADDLGASGWDEQFGWGLLDADEAVSQARDGTSPTSTTSTTSTTTTSSDYHHDAHSGPAVRGCHRGQHALLVRDRLPCVDGCRHRLLGWALPPRRRDQETAVRKDDHSCRRLRGDRRRYVPLRRRTALYRRSLPLPLCSGGVPVWLHPRHHGDVFLAVPDIDQGATDHHGGAGGRAFRASRSLYGALRELLNDPLSLCAEGGPCRPIGRSGGDGFGLRLLGARDQGGGLSAALWALDAVERPVLVFEHVEDHVAHETPVAIDALSLDPGLRKAQPPVQLKGFGMLLVGLYADAMEPQSQKGEAQAGDDGVAAVSLAPGSLIADDDPDLAVPVHEIDVFQPYIADVSAIGGDMYLEVVGARGWAL